jgi:hypothetical protein
VLRLVAGLSVIAFLSITGLATAAAPIARSSLATPIATAAVTLTRQPAVSPASSLRAVPSGRALVAGMRSAIRKNGSVHFDFLDKAHPPSFAVVETNIFGDASWRGRKLLHQATTIVRQGLRKGAKPYLDQRIELEIAGGNAAWRPGRLSWTCERMPHVHVLASLLAMEPLIKRVMTVELSTVKGRAAWRVRARGTMPGHATSRLSVIEYSIAAANDLPLRVAVTIPDVGHRRSEILSERYTHWGENVMVSLPARCRK